MTPQFGVSLTDDSRVVVYDLYMFIIEAPDLSEPIADDDRTVVCPFIDVIAYDTFEYRAQDEGRFNNPSFNTLYGRNALRPNFKSVLSLIAPRSLPPRPPIGLHSSHVYRCLN